MELSTEVTEFINKCGICGVCKSICPLLASHGTPGEILGNNPEDAFLCTNCGACNSICPAGFSPAGLFLRVKQDLIQSGRMSSKITQSLVAARSFTTAGHRFPFIWYPRSDIVFWPGCSLSGTSPDLVHKTRSILSRQLGQAVGLVFDCCFDPLYQMGDLNGVETAIKEIQERLESNKITCIITGCVNCQKILSSHLHGVRVNYVLEILSKDSFTIDKKTPFFLHHPCTAFGLNGVIPAIKKHLNDAFRIEESSPSMCCGNGGGLATISPALANTFTTTVTKASAGKPIITYCMGCKIRFIDKGKETYHILEFLPGTKRVRKIVSPMKRWINRLLLAMGQRVK
jgi:Fe-S oxidoreductase